MSKTELKVQQTRVTDLEEALKLSNGELQIMKAGMFRDVTSKLEELEANSKNVVSKEELEKVIGLIVGGLESRVGQLEEHLRSELNSLKSKLKNLDHQIYL